MTHIWPAAPCLKVNLDEYMMIRLLSAIVDMTSNQSIRNLHTIESANCLALNRTAAKHYTYSCTTSVYNSGNLSQCEVGDLSGKFGLSFNSSGNEVFSSETLASGSSEGVLTDYLAPLTNNFKQNLKVCACIVE